MKKLALVVVLLASIAFVGSLYAESASAFFPGGGSPFGMFFGGAKTTCAPMYCAPYYCCPPVACKPVKKGKKAAAPAPAKAKAKEKKAK